MPGSMESGSVVWNPESKNVLDLLLGEIGKSKEKKKVVSLPPPQALRFSHGRGERETRVTGDEPQGTMGRVQTAVERLETIERFRITIDAKRQT